MLFSRRTIWLSFSPTDAIFINSLFFEHITSRRPSIFRSNTYLGRYALPRTNISAIGLAGCFQNLFSTSSIIPEKKFQCISIYTAPQRILNKTDNASKHV